MKRLFSTGLVTTLLGVGCIVSGVVLYFKDSQTAAAALVTLGLVFLRSKDSLIGLK